MQWKNRRVEIEVRVALAALIHAAYTLVKYQACPERQHAMSQCFVADSHFSFIAFSNSFHDVKRGSGMQADITLLTLGVDDLERAVTFYRDGLGFSTNGIVGTEFENGAVAFFNLKSGLKLALWPRKSLAADSGVPLQASSATELSLGHNVASSQEVDSVMRQAAQAGARVVKPAQATFYGGYAGYFQDPDGHLWEVAFNPGLASLG